MIFFSPVRLCTQCRCYNIYIVTCADHYRSIVLAWVTANVFVTRAIQPFQFHRRGNGHLRGGLAAVGIRGRHRVVAVPDAALGIRAGGRIGGNGQTIEDTILRNGRVHAVAVRSHTPRGIHGHRHAAVVAIKTGHILVRRSNLGNGQLGGNRHGDGGRSRHITTVLSGHHQIQILLDIGLLDDGRGELILCVGDSVVDAVATIGLGHHNRTARQIRVGVITAVCIRRVNGRHRAVRRQCSKGRGHTVVHTVGVNPIMRMALAIRIGVRVGHIARTTRKVLRTDDRTRRGEHIVTSILHLRQHWSGDGTVAGHRLVSVQRHIKV